MIPGYDLYRAIQQLYESVAEHKERLVRLEQSIERLHEAIMMLRDMTGTHVDKIEYRFDQLKVEKLEGTLNIGITPQSSGMIEQLLTDQQQGEDVQIQPEMSGSYVHILQRVHQYLDHEAAQDCIRMEKELNKSMDADHRKMMIEDVKRQVDGRIKEYLQQTSASGEKKSPQALENEIAEKVKRDVRLSLQNYLQKNVSRSEGE